MSKKVFISGGGTGGHFYPALETARFLNEKGYDIFYFGTNKGIESKKDFIGKKFLFDIEGIRGKTALKKFSSAYKLLKTELKIKKFINKEKPDFCICFGGYTSIPLGIAAKLSGVPLYIHEQNSIPSYSNLILSKFAKKVFTTFEFSKKYFPERKVINTGLPIRKSLKNRLNLKKTEARKILNIPENKRVVLIFGGSQGAKRLNEVCIKLAKKHKDIIFVNIQGKSRINEKLENLIIYNYFEDMGILYRASDLVISRAGSGTVNELLAFGKFSIYIPYPYAASNHQYYNVKWIEDRGLSKVLEEKNINELEDIFNNVINLDFNSLEGKIRKLVNLDAQERIFKEIVL